MSSTYTFHSLFTAKYVFYLKSEGLLFLRYLVLSFKHSYTSNEKLFLVSSIYYSNSLFTANFFLIPAFLAIHSSEGLLFLWNRILRFKCSYTCNETLFSVTNSSITGKLIYIQNIIINPCDICAFIYFFHKCIPHSPRIYCLLQNLFWMWHPWLPTHRRDYYFSCIGF